MRIRRAIVAILIAICLFGCEPEPKHAGKRLMLEWSDTSTNSTFRVTESPGPIVKQNCRLHVERDGAAHEIVIDDDAVFSTVAFVRHDRWLLVVCRGVNEVWAGYDYDARQLFGEGQGDKLPFTKWNGEGTVVAERKLNARSASPAGLPRH